MSGTKTGDVSNIIPAVVSVGRRDENSQVYSFSVVLASGAAQSFDLKILVNLFRISSIQGIFADNSAGTVALNITTQASPTPFIVPAGFQAILPVYLSADNVITLAGNGTIKITLLNFPTPACVWPTSAVPVSIAGTVTVQDVAAEGYLANLQPGIALTSLSQVSPAVAASTQLAAALPTRKYLMIQSAYNVAGSAFHDIWINFLGGTASVGGADCIRLAAGAVYESDKYVTTAAINYFDATGSNQINAYEG